MATGGASNLWADTFCIDLLPGLFDLIIQSWKTFTQPSPYDLEVPITKRFCVHLENSKDRSIHLFRIDWDPNILDDSATNIGRIDIRITHGYDANEYFSFECKRLNLTDKKGKWSSLAGEYVDDGVMRYINQQYSGGDNGGMIGYVMDGDTMKAINFVNDAIQKRKDKLCINHKAQLKISSVRPKCKQTKETEHSIKSGAFTVHHIFLPITNYN
jgi:hypothetical protein